MGPRPIRTTLTVRHPGPGRRECRAWTSQEFCRRVRLPENLLSGVPCLGIDALRDHSYIHVDLVDATGARRRSTLAEQRARDPSYDLEISHTAVRRVTTDMGWTLYLFTKVYEAGGDAELMARGASLAPSFTRTLRRLCDA